MKKKFHHLTSIVALAFVLMGINLFSSKHWFRFDLTDNQQYTLSDSTKNIVSSLDDVLTLRIYFSENLPPQLLELRRQVTDLCEEFKQYAGDKLQVEYKDPGKSPAEEQKLAMLGIPPVQLNVINKDKQEVAKVYLGAALFYQDKTEVIPLIDRIDHLEYELVENILKISEKEKPRLAFWVGAGETAMGSGFKLLHTQLERRFSVVDVEKKNAAEVLSEANALLLLAPEHFSAKEVKLLDGFIERGGNLLAFVDAVEVKPGLIPEERKTGIEDLLKQWGIEVRSDFVLDASNAFASFSGGAVTYHLPYPFWPKVLPEHFHPEIPMVSHLESLVLPWASSLTLPGSTETLNVDLLARTTPKAISTSLGNLSSLSPDKASELFQTGVHEELNLAAYLHGVFPSLYHQKKTALSAKLVLVGTSRFLRDNFLQLFPENILFLENAVDALTTGDALVGIRSRLSTHRPLREQDEAVFMALRVLNLLVAPLILLTVGGIILFRRKRKRKTLLASLEANA